MTYRPWTPEDCFAQLKIVGVTLSLTDDGKLKVRGPGDLNMDAMLPVIKKYKPELARILKKRERTQSSKWRESTQEDAQ